MLVCQECSDGFLMVLDNSCVECKQEIANCYECYIGGT